MRVFVGDLQAPFPVAAGLPPLLRLPACPPCRGCRLFRWLDASPPSNDCLPPPCALHPPPPFATPRAMVGPEDAGPSSPSCAAAEGRTQKRAGMYSHGQGRMQRPCECGSFRSEVAYATTRLARVPDAWACELARTRSAARRGSSHQPSLHDGAAGHIGPGAGERLELLLQDHRAQHRGARVTLAARGGNPRDLRCEVDAHWNTCARVQVSLSLSLSLCLSQSMCVRAPLFLSK